MSTGDHLSALRDYNTYADYSASTDPARARLFIVACRRLLAASDEIQEGSDRVRYDAKKLREEMRQANRYLRAMTRRARGTKVVVHGRVR